MRVRLPAISWRIVASVVISLVCVLAVLGVVGPILKRQSRYQQGDARQREQPWVRAHAGDRRSRQAADSQGGSVDGDASGATTPRSIDAGAAHSL